MKVSLIALIVSLAAQPMFAQGVIISPLDIDLSNHILRANAPNQKITVPVRNSWIAMDFTGVSVSAEISQNELTASPVAPRITGIDLFSGTIFDQIGFGGSGSGAVDGSQMEVTYQSGTSVRMDIGEHRLATVSIDTTGVFDGRYDFGINATYFLKNGSELSPINLNSPTIDVIELVAIPEPSTCIAFSSALLFGFGIIRRRWRR